MFEEKLLILNINHLNNVSSNLFQNILSGDERLEQMTSSAPIFTNPFSPNLGVGWENV
jgi:hypothetical protein